MTIYLATELTEGEPHNMEDERITVKWFSGMEMEDMIRRGRIIDGKTILGYLAWSKLR